MTEHYGEEEFLDNMEKVSAVYDSEYFGHIARCDDCRILLMRIKKHFRESKPEGLVIP